MKKKVRNHLAAMQLALNVAMGIRRLDTEIFGKMNSPVQVHQMRKKSAPPKQPRRGVCLCRNPMPLTMTELQLLAGFNPGKAKKKFVKSLKQKYGKV